ncbi:hypothetical protein [Burkholderia sp. BE17]|uniref:hypothetical protein n=1 Tax=Burkholderia sp. BE17 TaxID=2656644 RepID=UPI00128D2ABF|nr:hypothetical protein [Burkholderia sp. BE17]MPV66327.1 hypothetical protein [Burkholderia sp. BE17]
MADTKETTRRLVDAGLNRRQAMALAGVLHDAHQQPGATKADLTASASMLTRTLVRTKAQWITWQLILAVTLFVALRLIH